MHKITKAVLGIIVMFGAPAFAAGGETAPPVWPQGCHDAIDCNGSYNAQMHKGMQREWYGCTNFSECTVVSGSCTPSVGVNIQFKQKAQAAICQKEDCSGNCNGSAIQATSAICVQGMCVPDMESRLKELYPYK